MERVCGGVYLLSGKQVSKGMLSNWESGRYAPSLACASALSQFLGVSLDYIIGNTDIKDPAAKPGIDLSDGSAHLVAMRLLDPRLTSALKLYFELSGEQKQQVLDMIEFLHKKARKKKA